MPKTDKTGLVEECQHVNISPDYYAGGTCMEYCSWSESFCRDCRRYLQRCQCGCCNGEDGWSNARRRAWNRMKEMAG